MNDLGDIYLGINSIQKWCEKHHIDLDTGLPVSVYLFVCLFVCLQGYPVETDAWGPRLFLFSTKVFVT